MAPRSANQERAKRIASYYLRVNKDKQRVVSHFVEEGVPSRTVHRILRQFDESGDVAFKKIPGRSKKIAPDEAHEKIASLFKANPNKSTSEAARELGVSRSTLTRLLFEMRSANKQTFKAPSDTTFCPMCRQKCDPELLQQIRLHKKKPGKRVSKMAIATNPEETIEEAPSG